MSLLTYLESIDNEQPGGGGFSYQQQRVTGIYMVNQPTLGNLQTLPTDVLGNLEYQPGDGRLGRDPPLAHPVWPWMYASNISNITGVGRGFGKQNVADQLEIPTLPSYWLYEQYKVSIEFTPRTYPVLLDTSISKYTNGSWFPAPGDTNRSGTPYDGNTSQTFPYCNEWERYCDYDVVAKEQAAEGGSGSLAFQTQSGSKPPTAPTGVTITGRPRIVLPNQLLRVVWYQIPWRYVTSAFSYFIRWLGRINQNQVTIQGTTFPAGSLLYIGYTPKKYTAPLQEQVEFGANTGLLTVDKWCDIELDFLYTNRTGTDVPSAGGSTKNYITKGWNLQPWVIKRLYYYSESKNPTTGVPFFLSAPFEAMQYDPDASDAI